jgi:PAS domain S-box-containing protein
VRTHFGRMGVVGPPVSSRTGIRSSGVLLDQLPLVTYAAPVGPSRSPEYVSPQIEALLGFPAEDWVSGPEFWLGRIAAPDRETFLAAFAEPRAPGESLSVEYRLLANDGREVWVRDIATVVMAEDGSTTTQGFLTDITREKALELALARERAQTDAFFRDASIGMTITDAEGRFVRVNEALARMNGRTPEEHVGRHLREIIPAAADGVEPLLEEVWRTGKPVIGRELAVPVASGETVNSLVSYFPVDAEGEKHFGGIVIDVTELHRSLSKRAEAEREYRRLIEKLPLVTYVNTLDTERRTSYVSPQVEELFGHAPAEWLADHALWDRVVHPDDLERVQELEDEARSSRGKLECEYRIVSPDGRIRWVLDTMHTEHDAAGAPLYEQGFVIDITDRKRAEQAERDAVEALRASEEQLHAIFDNALDSLVIVDDDGRYIDVNAAACTLFGRTRDELLSLSSEELSSIMGSTNEVWREFLVQGKDAGATTITRPDGTRRETEFTATANVLPGRHLSILRDVTERKQLERALWEAQKLESVGALAGGVAHDFNNMLMAVSGYAHLLLERFAPGSVERHHAEEIEHAADRATKLTAQLLAFGRRQVLQPRAVDLNALVADLSPMLVRAVGSQVALEVEPHAGLRAVRADPAQLEHVVLNIVVNAAEAMPAGGRVSMRLRNVDVEHDVEASDGVTARELATGPYVELSISDTGEGLDPDALEHVFEPFFTTKAVGLGEGLGLSTAYGIVKQSGGTIVADSGSGSGATFRVYLPASGEGHDLNGGHEKPPQR